MSAIEILSLTRREQVEWRSLAFGRAHRPELVLMVCGAVAVDVAMWLGACEFTATHALAYLWRKFILTSDSLVRSGGSVTEIR